MRYQLTVEVRANTLEEIETLLKQAVGQLSKEDLEEGRSSFWDIGETTYSSAELVDHGQLKCRKCGGLGVIAFDDHPVYDNRGISLCLQCGGHGYVWREIE